MIKSQPIGRTNNIVAYSSKIDPTSFIDLGEYKNTVEINHITNKIHHLLDKFNSGILELVVDFFSLDFTV